MKIYAVMHATSGGNHCLEAGTRVMLVLTLLLTLFLLWPCSPLMAADPAPGAGRAAPFVREFFEEHGAVMLLIDPDDGAILDANRAAREFYGYGHRELTARTIPEINTLSAEEVAAEMARAKQRQRNIFFFRHRLADGRVRDVEVTSWPVELNGKTALFSIVHDVTDRVEALEALRYQQEHLERLVVEKTEELRQRDHLIKAVLGLGLVVLAALVGLLFWGLTRMKKTRDALRESEQRLASVVETQQEMICRFLPDTTLTFVNNAYARLFGSSPEELVGRRFLELIPESEHAVIRDKIAGLSRERPSLHYSHQAILADGRLGWQEWTDQVILDKKGEVAEIQSVGRDITEQRQAEEALRESEVNFRNFFETMTDLILVGTPEGRIQYVNSSVVGILGYSTQELAGMHLLDLYPAHARDEAEKIFSAMFQGQRDTCPLPLAAKNGDLIPVETRVWRGRWNGEDCVFGISKDLTRKQEAEQRFERLFRNNPALLALVEQSSDRFFDVNEAWLQGLGYSREEIIGKTATELGLFVHPEQQSAVSAILGAAGRIANVELRFYRKDGSILEGIYYAETITIEGQQYLQGVLIDITARREAELALQEKSEELERYFTFSLDLLCIATVHGHFVRLNPQWQQVLGYAPRELAHTLFLDLVHPDDMEATLKVLARLTDQEQIPNFVNRYRRKDGTYCWLEWRAKSRGDLIYATARDMTERHEMELALHRSSADLARSNADLEQFAYAISHDLRQPLRMVSSYLQLLQKELDDELEPDAREFMYFALDGATRMDAMIMGLLEYSRVGRLTDPKDWMDSRESLDEALGFLGPYIRECDGRIEVTGEWPRVYASRDELTRLFQNLIGNALKYRMRGVSPDVEVHAETRDEVWLFSVRDNGIGIDPGQQDRLFKVFARLHARTEFEGTGLGLALCRKIVDHHGGEIWVESQGEGKGSVFWFTLARDQAMKMEAPL